MNADKCPNCGHVFFVATEPQESEEPTGEGVSINEDKECQMALLDKAAWKSWQGLLARNSNFVALKEFIRSGAGIRETAIAGTQCKTKEGKTYKGYGVYLIWLDCQRELHGNFWVPSLEALEEWCEALSYPKTKAKRWLKECEKFAESWNATA
jgi:hypothetical protein